MEKRKVGVLFEFTNTMYKKRKEIKNKIFFLKTPVLGALDMFGYFHPK